MKTLSRRRKIVERAAFAGSLLLATGVLVASLGASSGRSPEQLRLAMPTPTRAPMAGLPSHLDWVVEGVAWRSETTECDNARLAKLIDTPIVVDRTRVARAEHWSPLAGLLKRRMRVVLETDTTLLLGQDEEAFRARITLTKADEGTPLFAGMRIARRDRVSSWSVTTSRLTESALPAITAAPLPLGAEDRLTAAGLAPDGTVRAALIEPASSFDELATAWQNAGWSGPAEQLASPGDSAVYRRDDRRVRVTRVEGDKLSLVCI